MAYSQKLRSAILALPNTRAKRLGKEALRLSVPVAWIAHHTGASRVAVYTWFKGERQVSPAYSKPVDDLIVKMAKLSTSDRLNPAAQRSRAK